MKKVAIFILCIIGILSIISYAYIKQLNINRIAQRENTKFEFYKNEQINGEQLVTAINKAVDLNLKNGIQRDNKGKFIDNEENSINIDIRFIDSDVVINMEAIYYDSINKFLSFYKEIQFKCTDTRYHEKSGKTKYMLFEQITQ